MEQTFDKNAVLSKTHWGTLIYAHIIAKHYPDDATVSLCGTDCGTLRNPFNGGGRTLRVWMQSTGDDAGSKTYTARHHDLSGTIPDGDALDFAQEHYRQSGQELLRTLDSEMHLNLAPKDTPKPGIRNTTAVGPRFSFFKAPVTNTVPYKSITVNDAYNYIVGKYARTRTVTLRSISDKKKARLYKAANFDYATFSGEFTQRGNGTAISESGLLCLDFDHVQDLEALFARLTEDESLTTVLLFRSPSGDGIKWVIEAERGDLPHSDFYRAVERYVTSKYGISPDSSGKEISRACFLPHDPKAYINPDYRSNHETQKIQTR